MTDHPNPVRRPRIDVIHGDSRAVLAKLADGCIDACVCDPPYALVSIGKRFGADGASPAQSNGAGWVYARVAAGFMGQRWDTGETAFDPAFWTEVLRVLKPGGHVVAASGTRTYHRLACAIEDAGFEIRDMVSWLYGSGFPKSHDVSKGIDRANGDQRPVVGDSPFASRKVNGSAGVNSVGSSATAGSVITSAASAASAAWTGWGTALKPACEPWVLARKPLDGTVAGNVLKHGVGALNIDGCRIQTGDALNGGGYSPGGNKAALPGDERSSKGQGMFAEGGGRIPGGFVQPAGRWPANVVHDGSEEVVGAFPFTSSGGGRAVGTARTKQNVYGDPTVSLTDPKGQNEGSAARFFYSAKADAGDRLGSDHPTVKPVDLMAWLIRLVTPPGGRVLDPFAGSGSTGIAALGQGFDAVLIEREARYVETIRRRLAWARGEGQLTEIEMARLDTPSKRLAAAGYDTPLFGEVDE